MPNDYNTSVTDEYTKSFTNTAVPIITNAISNDIKLWWNTTSGIHTNYSPSKYAQSFGNALGATIQNYTGINPSMVFTNANESGLYSTTPYANLYRPTGPSFTDFRSRLGTNLASSVLKARKDGTSSALNASPRSIAYALASVSPYGAYSVFNLNAPGKRGFGWGSHGDLGAHIYKSDFTLQSNVVTKWKDDTWKTKPRNKLIPFRGDRVNVIDYSKRRLDNAYVWRTPIVPEKFKSGLVGSLNPNVTQDFIKFYFTGPNLYNGNIDFVDDIMVFRATITTLDDSFSPDWSAVKMIGRADPNYHYSGYSRAMSLAFTVYATDRDELKPIYRKLNALAGYTAPTYDKQSIGLIAPWMRMTIGDLLIQQPVLMDSLQYSFAGADTPWEINIENDPEMKQVPLQIGVTMQFKVITDYLPEKNGQFYTLAKSSNKNGPETGTTNWLTDKTNTTTNRTTEANAIDAITLKEKQAKLKAIFN